MYTKKSQMNRRDECYSESINKNDRKKFINSFLWIPVVRNGWGHRAESKDIKNDG